jgi:hypothetical protein
MGGGASKANVLTEKQIQKYVKETVRHLCQGGMGLDRRIEGQRVPGWGYAS